MKIIGLTGPSGAGKSTLCEKFEELDIPCINTDDIYRSITNHETPCTLEIKAQFGSSVINANGSINRKELAAIVFQSENSNRNLKLLSDITHKYVWEEANRILTKHIKAGKTVAVIDAPALFSSKIFIGACDIIISVLCDKELRLERIVKRDGISRENALARMNAQPSDSFFIEHSDYYITNCGSPENMIEQLRSIFEQEGMYI